MDAQRFDNLARALAGRFSRRGALRQAGAAASAGLLASAGIRQAPALAQDEGNGEAVYTVIRRYSLSEPTAQVRQALQKGYVEDICKAKGFISYFVVEDEDGDFVTIAVFRSEQDFQNFADDEAAWIAANLADLLPAPDEAISGATHIHVGMSQAFRNTCPGAPLEPTTSPAQPTSAPPTAAPVTPTATPPPACTGEGCVCSTGTRRPCDRGLVCCPTTDLLGGPGICKTEQACHPNACPANGDPCPDTCSANEACPGCCNGYCNASSQCDDPPAPPCTGEGCDCNGGVQGACDAGLICCQTPPSSPGGPGVCKTEAECNPACTGEGCQCDYNDPSSCDQGLVCCAVQSGFICATAGSCPCTRKGCPCNGGVQGNCDAGLVCCQDGQSIPGGAGTCEPEDQCAPPPCTGVGCDCNGGVLGACDTGLVCCQNGQAIPGGAGTCQQESECPPPPCTGEGCACNGGVQGACDDGLVCCQDGQSIPGGAGTCTAAANCAPPPCTGEGCDCNGGVQGACDDGLICCLTDPSVPGGPGTCQPAEACGPPPCIDNGGACDATCNWGDSCSGCCSGYCNDTGQCDNAPPVVCTTAGCACTTGTEGACDEGLSCCSTGGDPGATGVCQASC
ncbi:MAG: hypothetical protein U0031_15320 [Thermomicrobiales bacterium]